MVTGIRILLILANYHAIFKTRLSEQSRNSLIIILVILQKKTFDRWAIKKSEDHDEMAKLLKTKKQTSQSLKSNNKLEIIAMIYQESVEKSIDVAATFGDGNE